jgi:hypothetical protein
VFCGQRPFLSFPPSLRSLSSFAAIMQPTSISRVFRG